MLRNHSPSSVEDWWLEDLIVVTLYVCYVRVV